MSILLGLIDFRCLLNWVLLQFVVKFDNVLCVAFIVDIGKLSKFCEMGFLFFCLFVPNLCSFCLSEVDFCLLNWVLINSLYTHV